MSKSEPTSSPGIETERLLLRPWQAIDRDAFRPIATDPEVMRYITGGRPWPDEQIDEFIQRQIAGLERYGFCLWRLLRKPNLAVQDRPGQRSERLIGFCGLQPWRHRPGLEIGYHGVIEIGWWLARDCWRQGFATEAARAVLEFGFERAGLRKIIAVTHRDNKASQRVAGRIGLAFERAIPLETIEIWVYSRTARTETPTAE
ncbi:MAG: GNAT family N-acetyltransferase [Bryobacterales bacterium]